MRVPDRHRFFYRISDFPALRVECGYDAADETRPCWPHDEKGQRYEAPSSECTYESWIGNADVGDLLYGSVDVEIAVRVKWGEDSNLELDLEGLVVAHYIPDVGDVRAQDTKPL